MKCWLLVVCFIAASHAAIPARPILPSSFCGHGEIEFHSGDPKATRFGTCKTVATRNYRQQLAILLFPSNIFSRSIIII